MIVNTSKAYLLRAARLPVGVQYIKKYTGIVELTFLIILEVIKFKLIEGPLMVYSQLL